MDLDAYHRGDSEVLEAVIDRCGPWVFALARRGFLCEDSLTIGATPGPIRVLPCPNQDVAATLTERVLAAALTPERRRGVQAESDIDWVVLEIARTELFRAGERAGRLVSLTEAKLKPEEGLDDLDRLIDKSGHPSLSPLQLSEETEEQIARAEKQVEGFLQELDERSQTLHRLRFIEGRSVADTARNLDCGKAAVTAHETRLRRQARSTYRAGPAELDALLARQARTLLPPPITWERLRRSVLTRTFKNEPAPFHRRLAWAVGVLGIGLLGWLAMFFDVLPSFDDDVFPSPRVELRCKPACLPGAEARVAILAPRNARRFAIVLQRTSGESEPLLVAPDRGSLRLPLGARVRTLPAPYPVRLPTDISKDDKVVAVFSEAPLRGDEVLALASGKISRPGVLTTTVSAFR